MTPLVSCEAISKAFGSQTLFQNISFGIFEGDRIGLLGLNGSGKSTLVKILAGLETPDEGRRVVRKGVRVGYVPQERTFPAGQTVEQALQEAMDARVPAMDHGQQLAQMSLTLGQAGFAHRDQPAEQLSGGWKKRLMVACELITEPDVLLLDEPTNHLDMEGIAWLEDLLAHTRLTYLVISHDRLFLERATKRVVELSGRYPNGYLSVDGNYSLFLERREDFIHGQKVVQEKMENRLRREVEWLRRGPKARTTKSQARIDEAHQLMEDLADVKQRNISRKVAIDFEASERETRVLIAAKNVRKKRGERMVLDGVTVNLTRGMRLGLVGLNGTGKTTLLKLLGGSIEPDSGTIKQAPDLKIVYFTQNRETLNLSHTLKQALSPSGGDNVVYRGREIHVASWARRFLFRTDSLNMPIAQLSGGERARILIAQLMLQTADVLLLDEPTNDLDIPTLEVLEASLEEFPGAVVLVSHDRYMLGSLCNVVLGLDGQGHATLVADLHQWEQEVLRGRRRADEKSNKSEAGVGDGGKSASSAKRKLSFKEKFELENIEKKILEAEARLAQVERTIQDPATQQKPGSLRELSEQLEGAQQEVDRLYARWTELEALRKESGA